MPASSELQRCGTLPGLWACVKTITPEQLAQEGSLLSRAVITLTEVVVKSPIHLESARKTTEIGHKLQTLQREAKRLEVTGIFTFIGKMFFRDPQKQALLDLQTLLAKAKLLGKDIKDAAKKAIKEEGAQLSEVIKTYGFVSQKDKNKLIDFTLNEAPHKVCEDIDKCSIESEERRTEIALRLVELNRTALCKHFDKFNITDEASKWRIVEAILAKRKITGPVLEYVDKFNSDLICENISKFKFTESRYRLAIILVEAKKRSLVACDTIQDFDLSEEEVITVAEAWMQNNQIYVCKHFHKFGITQKEVLIRLLAKVAENDGTLSHHIGGMGIADQDVLFELAKIAAKWFPTSLAKNFANYDIQDLKRRYAIVDILTDSDEGRSEASVHIHSFALDAEGLNAIARKLANKNVHAFCDLITKISLSEEMRIKAIGIAVRTYPKQMQRKLGTLGIANSQYQKFKEEIDQRIVAYKN